MIGPLQTDLITVQDAVAWIFGAGQNAGQNTGVLQTLISSLSVDFLRRTGRANQNGSVPSESPFNQAVAYSESYTGNGNDLLQIRNWPILSVSSVSVFGNAIPQSSAPTAWGWFVNDSGKFLALRGGPWATAIAGSWGGGWSGLRGSSMGRAGWPKAVDCIQVAYTAGFAARPITGELQTVPVLPSAWAPAKPYGNGALIFDGTNVQMATVVAGNATSAVSGGSTPAWGATPGAVAPDGAYLAWTCQGAPYSLTVSQLPWLSDSGVAYFSNGDPLTAVQTAPSAGQYCLLGGGSYLFASGDAGKQVLISYSASGTPPDIQEAMLRWVNLIYKRRGWEGIRSLMQKDAGSTIYTSFEIDPSIEKTIMYYRRRA
jgi:hypothetical protein